jgi:hypothetical protein
MESSFAAASSEESTRLNSIPSSYPGRLAPPNSPQFNSKLISGQAGAPKLDSTQFQAHIRAGWRPQTRLNSIPSSYPGRLAPPNSTLHSGLLSIVKVKVMLRPTVSSASPSWRKAPIWGLRPDLYCCWTD